MFEPENDIEGSCRSEKDALLPDLSYPGALELDVEKYLPYVEEFDISEEQKVELLKTLWSIMSAFVDLGWGIDNIPAFIPALAEFSSLGDSRTVDKSIHVEQFNDAAQDGAEKGDT